LARDQREQFDRNSDWFQAHASEILSKYRGKCICVAGNELFVADNVKDVVGVDAKLGVGVQSYPPPSWLKRSSPGEDEVNPTSY
jgi:hypothetical protein